MLSPSMTGSMPDCVTNMTALNTLTTSGLTEPITDALCKVSSLRSLAISNRGNGTYTCIRNMTFLTSFNLNVPSTAFPNLDPTLFCSLTSLVTLFVNGGAFSAPIPDCYSNLRQLSTLSIDSNLNGSIPTSWCLLNKLSRVTFYSPTITGQLPSCVTNWTAMTDFRFRTSSITGGFPPGSPASLASALAGTWAYPSAFVPVIPVTPTVLRINCTRVTVTWTAPAKPTYISLTGYQFSFNMPPNLNVTIANTTSLVQNLTVNGDTGLVWVQALSTGGTTAAVPVVVPPFIVNGTRTGFSCVCDTGCDRGSCSCNF
jgi:hypothetical protein